MADIVSGHRGMTDLQKMSPLVITVHVIETVIPAINLPHILEK
jgi:hypothetical protein